MQIGSTRTCNKRFFSRMLKIVFPILIGLLLVFTAPGWCQSYGNRNTQQRSYERQNIRRNGKTAQTKQSNKTTVLKQPSNGNNQRLRKNERKWERLPPQKQDELRRKMDTYKSLPPEDRELYQKRYEQLQQLPPQERNDVRNKLRRMDRLSPEEKEEIRKKFE